MGELAIRALRVVIVGVFAGLLVIQGMIVPLLGVDLEEAGAPPGLRWTVVGIGVVGVLAAEVTLVCVWRLLTMVHRETVFSRSAFRDVDVIIGAVLTAAVLLLALGVVLAPGEAMPPGGVLVIGIAAVAVGGVGLLVLVMRVLLAKAVDLDTTATTLRAELDEVI